MSSKRRSKGNRQSPKVRPDPVSFWREDEPVPEPTLIEPPRDPTATLRSIGTPPVANGSDAVNEFLKAVVKASSLVGALATSMDLVDDSRAESPS